VIATPASTCRSGFAERPVEPSVKTATEVIPAPAKANQM
jgi:hypothetical protein